MTLLTFHFVTRDPAAAAAWYTAVLGAEETSRITLPGGQILTVELRLGDSTLALSDEFPDLGIVSPLTLGGTYGALHLAVADAEAGWPRPRSGRHETMAECRTRRRAKPAPGRSPGGQSDCQQDNQQSGRPGGWGRASSGPWPGRCGWPTFR